MDVVRRRGEHVHNKTTVQMQKIARLPPGSSLIFVAGRPPVVRVVVKSDERGAEALARERPFFEEALVDLLQ